MQELSSIGLMPEDWGGETPMVQVVISFHVFNWCFFINIFMLSCSDCLYFLMLL